MQHTGAVPDLEAYLRHDVVFHRTLLQASGNPMFASLAYLVERVLDASPPPPPDARKTQ